MYSEGQTSYHAAGGTGIGMFEAAQQAGRPAIGVDTDQSQTASDYSDVIVASMTKRMDSAVFTTIENVVNGDYDGSSDVQLGSPMEHTSSCTARRSECSLRLCPRGGHYHPRADHRRRDLYTRNSGRVSTLYSRGEFPAWK
ncbi:BMP family ABC transporter substrate-binding protein [Natrialba swarupiae]|nr:BMP family ABC transporter substrate-binding protein [Natrialba swarupiae]